MGLNTELVEKAKELGIEVKDIQTDEALQKEIDNKIKVSDTDDLDTVKKKVAYWEAEAKKAFDKRDRVSADTRSLKTKISDLEKKLDSTADPEKYKTLETELDELRKFKTEAEKAKEENELKNKSEVEKEKIRLERTFSDFKKDMEKQFTELKSTTDRYKSTVESKEKEIDTLRRATLRGEIIEQAGKLKAYNPSQIARLIMNDFEYDKDVDKFFVYTRDSKGKPLTEMTISEYVEKFLKDPDNENLVVVDAKGGVGGGRETNTDKNRKEIVTESGKKYNLSDPQLKEEAEFHGIPVEQWVKIKEKKDAKLHKKKE